MRKNILIKFIYKNRQTLIGTLWHLKQFTHNNKGCDKGLSKKHCFFLSHITTEEGEEKKGDGRPDHTKAEFHAITPCLLAVQAPVKIVGAVRVNGYYPLQEGPPVARIIPGRKGGRCCLTHVFAPCQKMCVGRTWAFVGYVKSHYDWDSWHIVGTEEAPDPLF